MRIKEGEMGPTVGGIEQEELRLQTISLVLEWEEIIE
jgi:hypothetical protein